MELNNICYELIKDSFYYGKFGEFTLVIDKDTGCFNATKLCQGGGKDFCQWKRLDRVQTLISFCPGNSQGNFYEVGKIHKNKIKNNVGQSEVQGFYEVKESNNHVSGKLVTGQYVQKEFILDIASWISPEFYFKCSNIVNDFFIGQFKRELEIEKQKVEQKTNELEIEKQKVEQKTNELEIEKQKVEQKNTIIEAKTQEFEKADRFTNKLRDMVITIKSRQKDQIIYIATTNAYARQNRFKIGGVKSRAHLKSRLATYNSGRPVGDKMYYAYISETTDYHHLEQRISKVLGDHKDSNEAEVYNVHYESLQPIVEYLADRFDEEIKYHQSLFEKLLKDTIEKEPIIPEPIILNGAEFRKIMNGEVVSTQKLDFDTMDEVEKMKYVKNAFEEFLIFSYSNDIGSEDLNRKEFELFMANNGTKFNKRSLWSVTKNVAKELEKKIKF